MNGTVSHSSASRNAGRMSAARRASWNRSMLSSDLAYNTSVSSGWNGKLLRDRSLAAAPCLAVCSSTAVVPLRAAMTCCERRPDA